MRSRRWIGFLLMVAVGIAAGLFIGWALAPSPQNSVAPDTLRVDYQTDYVLMVAEVYQMKNDRAQAAASLALLGSDAHLRTVQQAIVNAQSLNYSRADIELLAKLAQTFQLPDFSTPAGTP